MASAAIETGERDGVTRVSLSGDWTLASLPTPIAGLEARLADLAVGNPAWNLVGIERIDSVSAACSGAPRGRRWA